MSRSVIWNISRPPRYDHFDTSPCVADYNRIYEMWQTKCVRLVPDAFILSSTTIT